MSNTRPFALHLFPAFIALTLVVAVIIYMGTANQFRHFYEDRTAEELTIRAKMFESNLTDCLTDSSDIDSLAIVMGENTETRYTVVDGSGKVLADSEKRPSAMDNHADRPEIMTAYTGKTGMSVRYSETMKVNFMYVAIPADTLIVRTSIPLTKVENALLEYKSRVVRAILIAAVVAALLGIILTWVISRPLDDLKHRAKSLAEGHFTPSHLKSTISEIAELSDIMTHSSHELEKRFSQITNQKERLRVVLKGMVEGVIALDQDEKVFLVNSAARKMLNIEQDNAKGFLIQELVRNVPFQQTVNKLLKTRETISGTISVPTDGDPRMLQLNGRILENNGGCLIVLHDVTDLKRLENLRRDFAGNVSHELRTPLTSIKGFVETLVDGAINEPDDAVHFLGIINKQVDRLNQLIEDLLTIARLEKEEETGAIDMVHQPLIPVVEQSIASCKSRAEKKDIKVVLRCDDRDIQGMVSDSLLEQACNNLIDNAVKYSGFGSIVTVKVAEEPDYLSIKVQDEGPGIPREHLGRLFERFYRVDKARSSSMGGTGLGLSIVKHIAGVHNGSVSVESQVGKGTTFTILLPKLNESSNSNSIEA